MTATQSARRRAAASVAAAVSLAVLVVAGLGLALSPATADEGIAAAETGSATPATTGPESPTVASTPTPSDPTTAPTPSAPTPSAATTAPPPSDPTASPTVQPTDEPSSAPTGAFSVSDAVLRWGVNDESNNRAFAPGTFNFLSAGVIPDPGQGGKTIVNGKWAHTGVTAWRARQGDVAIEKVTSDGAVPATWAGLSTGPDGEPILSPSSGIHTGHQVVVSGGTGTVDAAAGTARIAWKGSFSVAYYSGMTFFTVKDPTLVVSRGTARITATASGYASSMDDLTKWSAVAPRQVTLAELTAADLSRERGFTSPAAYLGVRYDAPAGAARQVRTGDHWGAFPASMLAFLEKVGMSSYWYSSGGAADRAKVAHPVSISWDAAQALEPEVPAEDGDTTPAATPSTTVAPPPPSYPTAGVAPVQPVGPALPQQDSLLPSLPAVPTELPLADFPAAAHQPPTAYALSAAPAATPDTSGQPWEWLLGALLLLGAAGLTASTTVLNRSKG